MKLILFLDPEKTRLANDATNRRMLAELVQSERSVTELSRRLGAPTVTVWKRVQKLLAAGLVDLAQVRKAGNLQVKLYRAAAARYVPADLLDARARDPALVAAAKAYAEVQKLGLAALSKDAEIPEGTDPAEYAIYVNLKAFVAANRDPGYAKRVGEIERALSGYSPRRRG